MRPKPRRMDPPGLVDRHSFLNPQQGLAGLKLGEKEPCPTTIPGTDREQLGQRRLRWRGQTPLPAQLTRKRTLFGQTAPAAGDQGQT